MSDFKIIHEKVNGIVRITSNSQYNNISAEEIHLDEGITARLYGTIKTAVYLKKGSTLYLHGNFEGKIINEGGEFNIY